MTKSELINEILSEWAYRVDDGQPNPKNKKHLAELSIVLSEMGLSNIKNELFENLEEEDSKQFSNPLLNKKLKYKNEKGEDKEAPIGNLLRLPKGSPGRDAAEKMLPKDGSPERDALNKSLGGEKDGKSQATPDNTPKGGEDAQQEDPIQKAAVMFDPKVDPAMGARMDTERDNLAKLAQTDKDKEAEEKADVINKEEDGKFNPIPTQDVNSEMPQADPETFGGNSDIPDGIQPEELHQFNTDIKKVAQIVAKAKENNQPIPDINLCDITVPGTNLYCDDNLGIPRDEMPQFKGKAVAGSRAAAMDADESGEVDTEPVFKQMLQQKGIKTLQTEVPADKLKATQKDLVGGKVIGMMGALEKDPHHPKITAPIYVSRDGYVIDGHHRWAAIVAYNASHPEQQIQMKTTVLDMDIKDAIPMCNQFAEDMGVAAKKADANKETTTSQPTENIAKELKNRKSADGEDLDIETTDKGSMIIGVEHGEGTESTKQTIDKIKSLPSDTKVMFVGEGGMSRDDNGNLELAGEQDEIRNAVKGHFKNSEESSWDENANVYDDNSPVYKDIENSLGSKSKAMASVWTNMVGQGDDMNADDYLDEEGKKWIIDQAKKGGATTINDNTDFNNLTDDERDDLYQLNYRDDDGYGETEISKGQEAYNSFRQKELDRKIKEAESNGFTVIAPVGNSHVGMWRQRNKPTQNQANKKEEIKMKQETYSKYEHLLDEVINEIMDEAPAKPKAKSVSVKAHDQGLEGKGGTAYGPIGKDIITHHNVKGNLVPLDNPTDLGGKAIKGAKKAVEPAPMAGYRTTSKEKDVVAQKAEPTKKAVNGKLSSKMEDDDVFFPKKKAYDKQTEIAGRIQKMPLSKEAKLQLISIVGKILRGQDLNNKEKELAGDWITIPATSEPKIYFATEAGDFSDHSTQVTFGKLPDEIRDALYDFAETNEVFDKGHPVKKKSMVASQLSNKKGEKPRTKVKPIIKKDKAGVVQSIKIGNTEMTRLPVPTEKDLIKQFNGMKPPMQNAEYEANLAVIALERHNAMLDDLATSGAGEIEIIDFGYDTSTSEGRKGTIDTIRDMMYDKLSKDFKKYYKGEIPKEAKTVLFALKNLSNPYDNPKGNVTQTLQQNLDAIASMMNNNPDFRAGVPDMQEIFDFMVKLGEGYAGFMPSASNWKVTDIVTYKATPNFKIKPGQSPAEVISQNIQQIKSTVMFEGGASVKYEKGGASAGYDKVMMTVYNKHKGFDTKKELLKMFDVYKWSFTPGESNRVRSSEDIRKKDAELNDTLKRAMEAGIITPAEKNQILAQGAKQAASMAAKVEKKVPFDKFKQCFGKNEKEQRANYENYKTQLGLWCKMGAMAESINNNDMRYQLFSNLRTKYSKAKAGKVKPPVHEVIDGVSTLNGMGWSYDPGIAATGKDCKFISMNNANSSHIEPVKRK